MIRISEQSSIQTHQAAIPTRAGGEAVPRGIGLHRWREYLRYIHVRNGKRETRADFPAERILQAGAAFNHARKAGDVDQITRLGGASGDGLDFEAAGRVGDIHRHTRIETDYGGTSANAPGKLLQRMKTSYGIRIGNRQAENVRWPLFVNVHVFRPGNEHEHSGGLTAV